MIPLFFSSSRNRKQAVSEWKRAKTNSQHCSAAINSKRKGRQSPAAKRRHLPFGGVTVCAKVRVSETVLIDCTIQTLIIIINIGGVSQSQNE